MTGLPGAKISGSDAEGLVGWANGLAMDFGASGVWNVDTAGTGQRSQVVMLKPWPAGPMGWPWTLALWASGTLTLPGTWKKISGGDAETMAGWANGLAMDFGASGPLER